MSARHRAVSPWWPFLVTPSRPGQLPSSVQWRAQNLTWLPGSQEEEKKGKELHRYDSSCPLWQELRDDPGNGLQGGEIIVPGSM